MTRTTPKTTGPVMRDAMAASLERTMLVGEREVKAGTGVCRFPPGTWLVEFLPPRR